MKPCSNCGSVCPDDAVFCPNCGASLSEDIQQASTASESPVQTPPTEPSQPTNPIPPVSAEQPQPPVPPAPAAAPEQPRPPVTGYTPPAQPPQPAQPSYGQPPYGQQPYGQQPYSQPGYPYPQGEKRTAPLVLGIIGIVFAILFPLVTYCCSIPGLVMANQDVQRGLPNQNARVLNIVALVLAVINSFLGILMQLT